MQTEITFLNKYLKEECFRLGLHACSKVQFSAIKQETLRPIPQVFKMVRLRNSLDHSMNERGNYVFIFSCLVVRDDDSVVRLLLLGSLRLNLVWNSAMSLSLFGLRYCALDNSASTHSNEASFSSFRPELSFSKEAQPFWIRHIRKIFVEDKDIFTEIRDKDRDICAHYKF